MAKCKYCNVPIDGDIPNDHEYLIDWKEEERDIDVTISTGNQQAVIKDKVLYTVWADIYQNKIVTGVNEECLDGEGLREIKATKIYETNINFCPICGRRLKNEKEE